MTNQQTLEKAIKKAIEGGWSFNGMDWKVATYPNGTLEIKVGDRVFAVEELIYLHDFARALWPMKHTLEMSEDEEGNSVVAKFCPYCGGGLNIKHCWQAKLQQMVIADDPIKYLGENI